MNQFFKKYLLAIYIIVAALAVIVWLFALGFDKEDIWYSTWLNLSTELLGVVLVFFLVHYAFQVEEMNTSKRIDLLLQKLENEKPVEAAKFFHPQPDLEGYIKEAKQIDICGVTLGVFMEKNFGALRTAVYNGAQIRLMLIERSADVYKMCALRSETYSASYFEKKHASTFENLDYLLKYAASLTHDGKGFLQVGLLKFPPTCGVEVFDFMGGDEKKGKLKIEIYTPNVGRVKQSPIFTLDKRTDADWVGYFQNHFDSMWARSEKYVLPETK